MLRPITALALTLIVASGCSRTRIPIRADAPSKHPTVQQLNLTAVTHDHARVRLLTGESVLARYAMMNDGVVTWTSADGDTIGIAPSGDIDRIAFVDTGSGAGAGFATGAGVGLLTGAVIGIASLADNECDDDELLCIRFDPGAIVMAGALVGTLTGGTIGLIAGAATGTQQIFEFQHNEKISYELIQRGDMLGAAIHIPTSFGENFATH